MQHAMRAGLVLLVCATVPITEAVRARSGAMAQSVANPVRKVVSMLQSMQKKVEAEGEEEAKLYHKFKCYCETGGKDLSDSISAAEDKAPMLSSDIEAASGKLSQHKEDLKQAQADRAEAKDAIDKATSIREKEAAAFASEKGDLDANIAAVKKAITALERGVASGFLQTQAAQALRRMASKQDMLESDRQELVSFLSGSQEDGYAPKSGEVIGILKQMLETMGKNLADSTGEEESAIKSYEDLMAAKNKEIKALGASIEAKTKQIGELGVDIVHMKEDLSDTEGTLAEDKAFFAGLEKSCAKKAAEWEERSKTRAEELVALADTIKVLNDDDALELFKKTLPSAASFMQVQVSAASQRARAVQELRSAQRAAGRKRRAGLDFLVLTLTGKQSLGQGGFEKVVAMIDSMIEVLKKEQLDDDHKKEYCGVQFDTTDDKKKALEHSVSDEKMAIATAEEGIKASKEAIAALEAGIKELDKSVAAATENRKEEHAEFKEVMASNSAAKELLGIAKNRLSKFYNPKLYKPPPKAELSSEDRIYSNFGGSLTTTPAGGIADTGVTAFAQLSASTKRRDAPAPPPDTWDAYSKKSEENTGVMAMIDLLIKDLDKEMAEAETEEKDAQADYEQMMKDSTAKRLEDSKALTDKEGTKADLETALEDHKTALSDGLKELMATEKYIASLHAECDWLLKYFDERKEARSGEIESLGRAKAILSGADYAL
mmetsp:Transcript_45225/g.104562  ORF Transcript_45225/g.104562 Transcript_45225/m.104562 type:complete len:719 (+) Transcript_45225:50-2206(+)